MPLVELQHLAAARQQPGDESAVSRARRRSRREDAHAGADADVQVRHDPHDAGASAGERLQAREALAGGDGDQQVPAGQRRRQRLQHPVEILRLDREKQGLAGGRQVTRIGDDLHPVAAPDLRATVGDRVAGDQLRRRQTGRADERAEDRLAHLADPQETDVAHVVLRCALNSRGWPACSAVRSGRPGHPRARDGSRAC